MPTPKSRPARLPDASSSDAQDHVVGGSGHDGALDHDHVVGVLVPQRRADLSRHLAHVAQVDAFAVERRADRDERQSRCRGPPRRRSVVARRLRPTWRRKQLVEALLVDRGLRRVDPLDLLAVDVDAHDVVALSARQAPLTRPT